MLFDNANDFESFNVPIPFTEKVVPMRSFDGIVLFENLKYY